MGEFGPSFGDVASVDLDNNPDIISTSLFVVDQDAIILSMAICQTQTGIINWHLQMEVANAGDPIFVVPLVQGDTTSDRMSWYWQSQMVDDSTTLSYFPKTGIPGDSSKATSTKQIANAVYIVPGEFKGLLQIGHHYLLRWRMSSDVGVTWGDWEMSMLML